MNQTFFDCDFKYKKIKKIIMMYSNNSNKIRTNELINDKRTMINDLKFFVLFAFAFHFIWPKKNQTVEAIECDLEPKNNEGRLRKDLFCGYDRENRPILTDGPIKIRIKMIVKGFTFSDTEGTLTMATWLAMVSFTVHHCWC